MKLNILIYTCFLIFFFFIFNHYLWFFLLKHIILNLFNNMYIFFDFYLDFFNTKIYWKRLYIIVFFVKKTNSKISSHVINGVTGGNRKRKYLRVLTCKHLDPPTTPPTLPKNLIQNPLVVILFPISDTFLITVIYIFLKKGKWLVTACEKKKKKPIMAIYWIPYIYIYIYINY